uniref:Uncharacterized protein n=1 Tax=Arundo donax TaxID=35708 RepID=A0A0A9BL62_ARUDO
MPPAAARVDPSSRSWLLGRLLRRAGGRDDGEAHLDGDKEDAKELVLLVSGGAGRGRGRRRRSQGTRDAGKAAAR